MPPYKGKLSDDQIKQLVGYIRDLARRSSHTLERLARRTESRCWECGDIALNLPSPEALLNALLVITAILIAIIVFRPSITVSTAGKMLVFFAFCILPVLCGSMAASTHIERSIPAPIFRTIAFLLTTPATPVTPTTASTAAFAPSSEACVTFTSSISARRRGPKTSSSISPTTIANAFTVTPGLARLKVNAVHTAIRDQLTSNEMSCTSSGCHDTVPNVKEQSKVKFWTPGQYP
jgi:hypothetical protein